MAKSTKLIPTLTEKNKRNFFNKVSTVPTEQGCLEWMACKRRRGYGAFGFDGKTFQSHRLAHFLATGEDPGELQIRHSCNNPSCCNPMHLSTGTSQDDANDRIRAGRIPKGSAHSSAKLAESQVIAIRADLRLQREIALDYGVSRQQICLIKSRKYWAHVA